MFISCIGRPIKKFFNLFGFSLIRKSDEEMVLSSPEFCFHRYYHLRGAQRVQEHLAALSLPLAGRSVLEVGAGIGVHTSFFIDRGCQVTTSDVRKENLEILRRRHPEARVMRIDLEDPPRDFNEQFDIIYSYGVLYHLEKPRIAIKFMAQHCKNILILSTCVSPAGEEIISCRDESYKDDFSQGIRQAGCRPSRVWIYKELKQYFKYVYLPLSQPSFEEYPLDWSQVATSKYKTDIRAVFIASREKIDNSLLLEEVPVKQIRAA